jgi:MFS family permease
MLVAGRLADRFGARLVPGGLVAFGIAAVLPGFAHSTGALAALLIAVGVTTGLLDVAINAQASQVEASRRIRVMDGLHAGFSIGVLVGGVGAGLLRRGGVDVGWILAGIGAAVLVVAVANIGAEGPLGRARQRARLRRGLLVVGAVLALAFLVENGLEAWSALYLERTFGSSPAVSGLGPGLFAASMATGRLVAQRLAPPSVVARMLFTGIAAAAGLAITASAQHAAVALIGMVVAGAGVALSAPTLFRVAGNVGGEGGRGAAVSTVAIFGYLGFVAAPPLIGGVAAATSLRGSFVFLGVVALLLAGCAPILRRAARESLA